MAGNKSLPLVIPLAAATLFLTNLIKNYTTLYFLESVLLNKYKTNQGRKNAPFGAAPFAATDLAKQATGERKRLSRAASCGHPSLSMWKRGIFYQLHHFMQ